MLFSEGIFCVVFIFYMSRLYCVTYFSAFFILKSGYGMVERSGLLSLGVSAMTGGGGGGLLCQSRLGQERGYGGLSFLGGSLLVSSKRHLSGHLN